MIAAQAQNAAQNIEDYSGHTLLHAVSSGQYWVVGLATLLSVVLAALIHYHGLSLLNRKLPRTGSKPRRRVLLLIFVLLAMHVMEIWVFAFAHRGLLYFSDVGHLVGLDHVTMFDLVYYSAVVYTTVGFGDLVPVGPLRMLTGTEALVGLVMITWSASFTFLEMQRFWKARD